MTLTLPNYTGSWGQKSSNSMVDCGKTLILFGSYACGDPATLVVATVVDPLYPTLHGDLNYSFLSAFVP